MNSKGDNSQLIGNVISYNRQEADEYLAMLIKELKTSHKDQVDLMLRVYPPSVDEKSAMNCHFYRTEDLNVKELGLHPPVEALMNAILTDPGKGIQEIPSCRSCRHFKACEQIII